MAQRSLCASRPFHGSERGRKSRPASFGMTAVGWAYVGAPSAPLRTSFAPTPKEQSKMARWTRRYKGSQIHSGEHSPLWKRTGGGEAAEEKASGAKAPELQGEVEGRWERLCRSSFGSAQDKFRSDPHRAEQDGEVNSPLQRFSDPFRQAFTTLKAGWRGRGRRRESLRG